jgi:hypothetical protein
MSNRDEVVEKLLELELLIAEGAVKSAGLTRMV